MSRLVDVMVAGDVYVGDGANQRLMRLAGLIVRYNEAINLISRRDIGRLVSYHFYDSASLLPIIRPRRSIRVLDIGGSNGLPGLVLSCICPNLEVLIRDGRSKRRAFLEEACRAVGATNTFEVGRADDRDFVAANSESFDLIVARAVTRLKLLLKWCLPLLKPGAMVAAYKGSRCEAEVALARKYFFDGGGSLLGVIDSPLKKRYNPLRKFAIAVMGN